MLKLFGAADAVERPAQRQARATFYNFWAGRRRLDAFRDRLRADLTAVLRCWPTASSTAQIAARFPLSDAGSALALAESRTVAGKVVIVPDA